MAETSIIAGIDEAGYGPLLGPLVTSAAAFEMPRDVEDECLWRVLSGAVTRSAAARDGRVCVTDSKKLYSSKKGLAALERTALAAVGAWRGIPSRLDGLLTLLAEEPAARLREYPWYGEADTALPLSADAGSVRIAATLLSREAETKGVRMGGLFAEVLPEGHFNRLVGKTDNKAVVASGLVLRLVQRIADAFRGKDITFIVDKQGGRDHYGLMLRRAFEGRRLRVLHEDRQRSEYELIDDTGGGRANRWRIAFCESGESRHLSVALASCVSKYLREAFMHRFNAYWTARVPDLRPTAGYYSDGLRFLEELRGCLPPGTVNDALMVRQR